MAAIRNLPSRVVTVVMVTGLVLTPVFGLPAVLATGATLFIVAKIQELTGLMRP